jgi:hypothetical protein
MHPLENYIQELGVIRSSGAAVKETSYYPALAYVTTKARRISAILLLTPSLNANHSAVKRACYRCGPRPA